MSVRIPHNSISFDREGDKIQTPAMSQANDTGARVPAITEQPVLVLTGAPLNPFCAYLLEILDIEGLFCRDCLDLLKSDLSLSVLQKYDVVLLPNISLSDHQIEVMRSYVKGGGNLIALRPPQRMASIFGLEVSIGINRRVSDRYIGIEPNHALAYGIDADTLQFHGEADLYLPRQADVLARINGTFGDATLYPAVVTCSKAAGKTAAFTYDLAASTVLFRQGRFENRSTGSNPDSDGDDRYIPNDLFVTHLDERLKFVPQADIHQELLIRILHWMCADRRPIPRAWYFPNAAPSVAYFNGDSDEMSLAQCMKVISTIERYGGKYSLYLLNEHHEMVPPEQMNDLRGRGHSFGQHVALSWLTEIDEAGAQVEREIASFKRRYGYVPLTNRGHCLIWPGWTEMAAFLARNGIRMDQNFIPRRFYRHGYLNGSGLPGKFMDENGAIVDIYEQGTLLTDDGAIDDSKFLVSGISQPEMLRIGLDILDACASRYHTVFQVNIHPKWTSESGMWLLEALLKRCWESSIPMISGDDWVRFNDARRHIHFSEIAYNDARNVASFLVSSKKEICGLTLMTAAICSRGFLSKIVVNGEEVSTQRKFLKGDAFGLFILDLAENSAARVEAHYSDCARAPC